MFSKITVSKEEWEHIVEQTNERWHFPNCFAAVYGKHVGIICPKHSGSEFYNDKGFYSIVLLAFVDSDYRFLIAEVSCQGRISDGGVYRNSNFYSALRNNNLIYLNHAHFYKAQTHFWSLLNAKLTYPLCF